MSDTPRHPGEHLRALLEAKGWTQDELAAVLGITRGMVINILQGRSGVTADMAVALAGAFGMSPEEWMKFDSDYRLSKSNESISDVSKRAKLFSFPIRELQRRHWITDTNNHEELERSLKQLLEVDSLDEAINAHVAMRKGEPDAPLQARQVAWFCRARQLAKSMPIQTFRGQQMNALKRELRTLAAYPGEARQVSKVMRDYGIRFVVVEHLAGSRVDGAAFWLDDRSPAIAVSLRLDRIDNFWFTLMHECAHIEHRDAMSVDVKMGMEEREQPLAKEAFERRADEEAGSALVPLKEMDSFIRRMGPIYSKPNIIQFAHRIKMHPGIIVGQLQHRSELSFRSHHEMQPRIRAHVISTALTDGWEVELSPGSAN